MDREQFEFMMRTLGETDSFKLYHKTMGEMQIHILTETLSLLDIDGFKLTFDDIQYVEAKHLSTRDSDIVIFKLYNYVIADVRADYLSFCEEDI